MGFELPADYKQVPERIADLKAKHPDASLQPADLSVPFQIVQVGGQFFIVYVAAAFRSPDDPRPGVGAAWEPVPGRTPYTKDSELQNAETSAWGRAIVAALASESKAVASAEDVRNRRADQDAPPPPPMTSSQQFGISEGIDHLSDAGATALREWWKTQRLPKLDRLSQEQADIVLAFLPQVQDIVDAAAEVAAGA